MHGKFGKTRGNRGNRWENEEITGRKLWKNRGNTGKGLKKRHEIEARQSFEKGRNIEASILKKLRIRSSTGMKWRKGKALKKLGT